MSAPTVSVAMATRNGVRFLAEQLRSILTQSLLPTEIVVSDDASTDGTLDLVRSMSDGAPVEVRILRQQTILGPTKNFEAAIGECRGDIIALCDQDDVWLPNKLETLVTFFSRNPSTGAVVSNARLLTASGITRGTLWDELSVPEDLRRSPHPDVDALVGLLLRRTIAFGSTIAFAGSLRPFILPIEVGWGHDNWIAVMAAAAAPIGLIPEPLIEYRQHGDQVSGAAVRSLRRRGTSLPELVPKSTFFDSLARTIELRSSRSPSSGAGESAHRQATVVTRLRQKSDHLRRRESLPATAFSRVHAVISEARTGDYRRYSNGWRSALVDLWARPPTEQTGSRRSR